MQQPFNQNLPVNPSHDIGYEGGQLFDWAEGMPRPKRKTSMGKEQVQNIHNAAAALPYQGEWNPLTQRFEMPPDMVGLTMAEAAIYRQWLKAADGDTKAYEKLMDRMLGKPKQAVETVSMKLSYSEFLDMLATQDIQENVESEADNRPASNRIHEPNVIETTFIFDPLPGEETDDDDEDEDLLDGI